jgi:hypothetical protein
VTRTPPPSITATTAADGVTGPVPERISSVTGQFADPERIRGVRAAVPDLHGQHRVVKIQGTISGRAKAVHCLGATAEQEEGGGAQNRRQEAAVVVATTGLGRIFSRYYGIGCPLHTFERILGRIFISELTVAESTYYEDNLLLTLDICITTRTTSNSQFTSCTARLLFLSRVQSW